MLSAVEGLEVAAPQLKEFVLPICGAVIVILFAGAVARHRQRRPGVRPGDGGLVRRHRRPRRSSQIVQHPYVLLALSPTYAIALLVHYKWLAFVALGSVVLAVTGRRGAVCRHGAFRRARRSALAWLFFVLPCLVLNYFGQGALVLADPTAIENPFFLLGAGLAAPADGDPGHGGDRDRQPGADLRRLSRWRGNACSWASCRA